MHIKREQIKMDSGKLTVVLFMITVLSGSQGSALSIHLPNATQYVYSDQEVTFEVLLNTEAPLKAIKVEWSKKMGDVKSVIWTFSIEGDEASSEWFDRFFYAKPIAPPAGFRYGHALTLRSAKLENGGTYLCDVTDGETEHWGAVYLTVCMEDECICNGPEISPPSPPMSEDLSVFWANVLMGLEFRRVLFRSIILHCYLQAQSDKKRKQWKSVLEDESND